MGRGFVQHRLAKPTNLWCGLTFSPFDRIQVDAQVENVIPQVNAQVDAQVEGQTPQVSTPVSIQERILQFCFIPRGILEIAEHLNYKQKKSVRRQLFPLLKQGRLAMTIPQSPNSRFQKYIAIK